MTRRLFIAAFFALAALSLSGANDDIRLTWNKKGVTMSPKNVEGIKLTTQGGYATIINSDTTHERTFVLSGKHADGGLTYKGKHRVTMELAGLDLVSQQGSPLSLKCGKRCTVKLKKGTENSLTDAPDTCHKAVLWCKGHLVLTGGGSLTLNAQGGHGISAKEYIRAKEKLGNITINATGQGCKGIRTAADFTQEGGNIIINTSGEYLYRDTTNVFGPGGPMGGPGMGGPGGPMMFDPSMIINRLREDFPGHIPEDLNIDNMDFPALMDSIFSLIPDSLKMRGPGGPGMGGPSGPMGGHEGFRDHGESQSDNNGEHGGFGGPMGHPGGPRGFGGPRGHKDSDEEGNGDEFPGGPDGPMGPPMKGGFVGTTKALKALGTITINGGTLSCTTKTAGAEGIEGKQGVVLQGGDVTVDAYDDAINSGGNIVFSGANVSATSQHNDAVDSNAWGDGAITIADGNVQVFSGAGAPEEGFDCDFSAIVVSGGTAISVGSGMGPSPSSPTEKTATQPTLLVQYLSINQGDKITVEDNEGHVLVSAISTVKNNEVHSLITSPELKIGKEYVVRINGQETRRFTLNSAFTTNAK